MNRFKKLIGAMTGLTVAITAALAVGLSGNASALACFQYDPNGFQTSQTPVFNNICNVTSPLSSTQGNYNLGDEPNFVRIRPNASSSPLGSNNPPLVDNLSSACNSGDKFDVWTYVHNDAESQFNDNGSGTAVAHNVKLSTKAPVNSTSNKFSFSSTVSASNAASVSDSTTLNCNGDAVKLTLVPGSVHYNNDLSQTTYSSLSDSAVNGTTALGNPTWGSGNVWGCWPYRVVIVYTVTVTKLPPPPVKPQVTAVCDLFSITASEDRKVTVSQFKFTAVNANFKNVVVNWGDTATNTFTNANGVVGQTHQFAQDNQSHTFDVTALVTFTDINGKTITSGGAGTSCSEQVSFTPNKPPTITPPPVTPPTTTPPTTTPPTTLVNTGAGSVMGLFAVASAAGAIIYRRLLNRRLSQQ